MGIRTGIVRAAASINIKKLNSIEGDAVNNQDKLLSSLIHQARNTQFGIDHSFDKIRNYKDFQKQVPVRDYENLKMYFNKVVSGEKNVLWTGKPKYLAKTSGTTSGSKYIPITKDSLPNHINSARNALFSYLISNTESKIFDGRMLFLSGSPKLEAVNGLLIGRLSGIINHEVPSWMHNIKLPDYSLNTIEPWEKKVELIIEDLRKRDLRVISGIPPWIQMLCEKLIQITGKNSVAEQFPNLELYIHGGVNYAPYHDRINKLIGKEINLVETYPASEGFIAFQDDYHINALRIISNSGIFYEFVPKEEVMLDNPTRIQLRDIEIDKDYALVLSSNAGLWAYLIGDLVRFVSKNPYRLLVTGRVSHYISAFGEHVISSEIDKSLSSAIDKHDLSVVEFMVAPMVSPNNSELPYHEWFIEFKEIPKNLDVVAKTIDDSLCNQNVYYKDLICNKILQPLKISLIKSGGFKEYMININKYGEQFKVTRVCNDRKIADQLNSKLIKI
ncbi:MAG: GH3 auxin-responsive promoter family protein [Saprospiraceae bacterium]|nr:GH3 auxin-responsive promoter family protein [Saprospiraceae bacterium]